MRLFEMLVFGFCQTLTFISLKRFKLTVNGWPLISFDRI